MQVEVDESCRVLTSLQSVLCKSPPGWTEAGNEPWGMVQTLAWQRRLGTGRLFTGTFLSNPTIVEIQESTRGFYAELAGHAPDKLVRIPERASVKPAGCPELQAHLDLHRRGSLQVVIALSDLEFLVWPGSHRVQLPLPRKGTSKRPCRPGFTWCSRSDLAALEAAGVHRELVPARAGDVLFMAGGEMVHGSRQTGRSVSLHTPISGPQQIPQRLRPRAQSLVPQRIQHIATSRAARRPEPHRRRPIQQTAASSAAGKARAARRPEPHRRTFRGAMRPDLQN